MKLVGRVAKGKGRVSADALNSLKSVPFEKWPEHIVSLRAVSANADGMVNSGLLQNGRYFWRKWYRGGEVSEFVLED